MLTRNNQKHSYLGLENHKSLHSYS